MPPSVKADPITIEPMLSASFISGAFYSPFILSPFYFFKGNFLSYLVFCALVTTFLSRLAAHSWWQEEAIEGTGLQEVV